MTGLELFFAILGSILSVIGIIVGIIGAKSISIASKNKNVINKVNDSDISIDNSVNNGMSSDDVVKIEKEVTAAITNSISELYAKQADVYKDNITLILKEASQIMAGCQQVKKVDNTWTLKFFECSSKASNEDIQKIWAKLLKSELTSENGISMRTMEILSNLSPQEALVFEKFAGCVIGNQHIVPKDYLDQYKELSFEEIQILKESGLISTESFLSLNIRFDSQTSSYMINNNLLLLYKPLGKEKDLSIGVYGFTRAGSELYDAIGIKTSNDTFVNISKCLKKNNPKFLFTLHHINYIDNMGEINYQVEDIIDK